MQGCGAGTQSRNIFCADVRGNPLPSYECSSLSSPSRSQNCYIPCPTDCVVSDWSRWSDCSHACNQSDGTQTRTRQLVAHGIDCTLSGSDFIETRSCVSPDACPLPSYRIQVGAWSVCKELPMYSGDSSNLVQFNESLSCDVGVRNRTNYCFLNDLVISETDCPIDFIPSEEEVCVLSCDVQECVYSAWSEYSDCSGSCEAGQRVRSRSLLRYPDDPQRHCSIDASGLQFEFEQCFISDCISTVYVWTSDEWSGCGLFPSNQPATCGLGYQVSACVVKFLLVPYFASYLCMMVHNLSLELPIAKTFASTYLCLDQENFQIFALYTVVCYFDRL